MACIIIYLPICWHIKLIRVCIYQLIRIWRGDYLQFKLSLATGNDKNCCKIFNIRFNLTFALSEKKQKTEKQKTAENSNMGCLLLVVKNLSHTDTLTHTHTHACAHKFKKCNIPLTEMTIYWWFLLFAIYFNSARKCIADVTPHSQRSKLKLKRSQTLVAVATAAAAAAAAARRAKVDAANKQSDRRIDRRANMHASVNIQIK